MNGELLLHRHQSPSNVCFVFLILVSRSNANFGIAFKPGEHGDGPRSSCTNFVGFAHAIMLASIGSKFCLGKEFPKSMAKWSKFGTSLGAPRFGPFGLNVMIKCSIMSNGTSLRSSSGSWMSLSSTPKRRGNECLNKSRITVSRRLPCFKASTKLGELETLFVGGTICILSGIGNDKLGSRSSPHLGMAMVVWG